MITVSPDRPLRADAQRNHDRILAAAGDALAEHGLDVSMEEIARRAGVGPATLYRRFPSKRELLGAIIETRLAELEPRIAAASADADAWQGLLAGLSALLESQTRNIALVQVLAQTGEWTKLKQELGERVFAPLSATFERAQAGGIVRRDLDPSELPVLVGMVAATIAHDERCGQPSSWPRYLALLADALRTPTPAPLPPL